MSTTAEKPAAEKLPAQTPTLDKSEFEALADFRYQLRRFLRFSELLTRRHGVTNLQYLLLLQVKGFPGREWANIGELAAAGCQGVAVSGAVCGARDPQSICEQLVRALPAARECPA